MGWSSQEQISCQIVDVTNLRVGGIWAKYFSTISQYFRQR
jgi:hypothetical protein